MSEMNKKTTNGTVEQIIEHMTADIQNSDGQYIQLGFTPPPTPNDPHIWSEFAQTQMPQNPFMPHYNARSPEPIPYAIDPNARFVSQNVPFNNYMPQNTIYVPDIQNASYEKLNMDMHGNKYVMYPNQAQYVMTNPDIPLCNFMHSFENRECQLFNQEMHQIQQPNNEMYVPDQVMQQDALKTKLLMQQQPTQNRTHLIENLVGNWTSNTNGTYSPFGNVQTQNSTNFFDIKQQDITQQQQQQQQKNIEHPVIPVDDNRTLNDFNAKNLKPNVKKQKQIAEVKPMRPTYSDVLTKSVPQQNTINKQEKIETKEVKSKNQAGGKKSNKEKFAKIQLNKQVSSGCDARDNQSFNGKIGEKTPGDSKVNLSRKWVSLDDVNEAHTNKDFLKHELNTETPNSTAKGKKTKKFDNPAGAATTSVRNDINTNKNNYKKTYPDNNSLGCQWTEHEDNNDSFKGEEKNINKNPNKKAKEPRSNSARQSRFTERTSEKPPGSAKRNQRIRKKDSHSSLAALGRNVQHYVNRWSKVIFSFLMWLLHLVSDIFSMSIHLGRDFGTLLWDSMKIYSKSLTQNTLTLLKRVKLFTKIGEYIDKTFGGSRFAFWNRWNTTHEGPHNRKNSNADGKSWLNSGLEHNINMPTTGEEAMKRLLACKGKDPYSILGVRPDCTDDDIKRYYKRQAFLVHPDKNPQPGAEEAFKILVHAFELIGEPERRQSYDRKVAESHQVEQAWSELNDLLSQLHQKMEYAANTIRCTNCTKRHRRVAVDRPCYAARMCSQCKIHHSAKEGDIWAESTCFGFLWHYYACMDGAVYDITEWAGCQRKNLKHLRPNSHNVQYRIVLGKQAQGGSGGIGQGGPGAPGGGAGPGGGQSSGRKHKGSGTGSSGEREADLESFLNNLYSQSDMSATPGAGSSSSHTETGGASASRNRKKNKRKK